VKSLSKAWRMFNNDDEEWLLLKHLSEMGRTPRPEPIEPTTGWWERTRHKLFGKPE